jgi:hypothetical protein
MHLISLTPHFVFDINDISGYAPLSDQYKLAFGNNVLGCWCWARGAQGASCTPASWMNFVHASLAKHGVLFCPDFHVSDLESNDYLEPSRSR